MMHPDLPTPKFKIGDTVFYPETFRREGQLDCPDCNGTRIWSVMTPAGNELEAACLRCSGQIQNLPSLKTWETYGSFKQLTIGSIQIDTKGPDGWQGEAVSYMCVETGIGSGSIYKESTLHVTPEGAQASADFQAIEANKTKAETPEAIKQRRFGHLTLTEALCAAHQSEIWHAWYAYHDLREKVDGYVKGEMSKDDLTSELKFEDDYRRKPDRVPVFDQILFAVEDGDLPRAQEAVKKLPFKIRRNKEEENADSSDAI